jgi:hypothetical protein
MPPVGNDVRTEVHAELAALRAQVRELSDRMEITRLLDRYVVLLDTQDANGFDESWPATVFTDDVRLVFPIGSHQGLKGLAAFHHLAKTRFDRTLHLSANHGIELDGDRAAVRLHVIGTHVHRTAPEERTAQLFDIGGSYQGEAVRTSAGWRISRWRFDLVWSAGPGPDYRTEV